MTLDRPGLELDDESLSKLGFKLEHAGPGCFKYSRRLGVGGGMGPTLEVFKYFYGDEMVESHLSLSWEYTLPTMTIRPYYGIRDNPTIDDICRLIAELEPK